MTLTAGQIRTPMMIPKKYSMSSPDTAKSVSGKKRKMSNRSLFHLEVDGMRVSLAGRGRAAIIIAAAIAGLLGALAAGLGP